MSQDPEDNIPLDPLQHSYTFDKFVEDLERREQAQRDAMKQLPVDHNKANRLRDARNREDLHNRIRWGR